MSIRRSDYAETDEELLVMVNRAIDERNALLLDYLGVDVRKAKAQADMMARERLISWDTALNHALLEQLKGVAA